MMRRQAIGALATAALGALAPVRGAMAGGRTQTEDVDAEARWFHASRRQIRVDDAQISYVERGNGPAALFLHGWPLNGFQWRGALARLAGLRRCVAPDFLGLGYSETPVGAKLSPVAQAEMILKFMDSLGITDADIVANDSGTGVAQLIAARRPDRVRTMLLTNGDIDTNSLSPALASALAAARAGTLDAMIARHFDDPAFAASPDGLGGICYTDPLNLSRTAIEVYFAPLLATPRRRADFQRYGVEFEPNPLPAIAENLRALPTPTRLLWGTGDVFFPIETARWLDATLPASRGIRRVPGAKLFFPEERPELIAQEARNLWRGRSS